MVSTLTVYLDELVLDDIDLNNVCVTLQVHNRSKKFTQPFSDMKLRSSISLEEDFLFIIFDSKNQEIGHCQVSLDWLKSSKSTEKNLAISRLAKSPEKSSQKKVVNIGKVKVKISAIKEEENELTISPSSLNSVYSELKETFEDFWEIQVPDSPDLENLGLSVINEKKYLNKTDFEHLKILSVGLNEKLKTIPVLQKELEESRKVSKKYQVLYEESAEKEKIQKSKYENLIRNLNSKIEEDCKQIESYLKENLKLKILNNELGETITDLQSKLELLESRLKVYQNTEKSYQELGLVIRSQKDQISFLESNREQLKFQLAECLKENQSLSDSFQSSNSDLTDLLKESALSAQDLKAKLQSQQSVIEAQNNEIFSLNSQVESYKRELVSMSALEENLSSSKSSYSSLLGDYSSLQSSFKDSISSLSSDLSSISEEKEKIWTHSRDLQHQNMSLQSTNLKYSSDISTTLIDKQSLQADLNTTQQLVILSHDLESVSSDLQSIHESSTTSSKNLLNELGFISEYLFNQSEQFLLSSRAINRLVQVSADKENEIQVLREMITEMQKKRAVYFPIKDDAIDAAIADYINTRGTDIPFTREDHGIYVFGSKRVFVKMENGKIVLRVGGGFMKIEDFVQVYTPQELERIENKKKEESNLQRCALLGNLGRNIVNEKTRGKNDISPEKAVRLFREVIGQKYTQCVGITKSPSKRMSVPSRSPKREVRHNISDESFS